MTHRLLTELFYSNLWNKVIVYDRDPVGITRGQADERSAAPPSTLSLTIPNPDRSYSPHDPRSPLYGLIGRNTPIRHTLLPGHVTGPLAHVVDAFNRTEAPIAPAWVAQARRRAMRLLPYVRSRSSRLDR